MDLLEVATQSVISEDRFREDLGDLSSLIESFQREGIIQPLAVKDNGDGTYHLLAGGRRHAAATKAGLEKVPVRCYPSTLNDLEMRNIELMENVCRKDLSYIETCNLRREILTLQQTLYGEKISTNPDAPGVSKRGLADMLGISATTLMRDIRLSEMAEVFPELGKQKDKSEANKLLNKMGEKFIREELAKRVQTKTAGTSLEKTQDALYNSYIINDFFEGVKQVPDRSIDFIEIDPPYGIDLTTGGQKRGMTKEQKVTYNEVPKDKYEAFLEQLAIESHRVLTNNAWVVVWCASEWKEKIFNTFLSKGFEGDIRGGIWYKGQVGQTNTPNFHLASSYEPFLYFRKGSPSIIRQGRSNVFFYKPVGGEKIHPTERPIEMIEDLIQTFCWEGSRIMVPFLGSGNTILAAANLGMGAFGWDLGTEYKDAYIVRVASGMPTRYKSYKQEVQNVS